MAAALAPSGAQATRHYPAALGALGVALLGVTLALPPVGVLLEVLAYLHWLDTGTYTVPLVHNVVPGLVAPAFLLSMRAIAAASVLSVVTAGLWLGYVRILDTVYSTKSYLRLKRR
jgi:hypothetical protein